MVSESWLSALSSSDSLYMWTHQFFLLFCFLGMFIGLEVNDTFSSQIFSKDKTNISLKINFVFRDKRQTPNPKGWEEYDGSRYTAERGYGWLTDISRAARDRGPSATIKLSDGTESSPQDLGRLELANWQGTHQENRPLVFRIDLPDGWYRVTCVSVDPGVHLPLVDQRSFKCRAHDVVFAGANYGQPLVIGGNQLVEDTGVVEVTEGHLRIVVGEPAYRGWTWTHHGPWYGGWGRWWGHDHRYAHSWYQKLTRTVDPGFHNLRLNSLTVERIAASAEHPSLVFRDFFNRDNSPDINAGVAEAQRWVQVKLRSDISGDIHTELYQTSIKLTGSQERTSGVSLLQQEPSPAMGIVRYSTRVSLFTGEGSQRYPGTQESGIILLAEPSKPTDFCSTFIGIALDNERSGTMGRLVYRVGDGSGGYRTAQEVPDTVLPFRIAEGEFEIVVEHDVAENILRHIRINGVDVTRHWSPESRKQRISQGLFGIRSVINNKTPGTSLRQFFWYYRVEKVQGQCGKH